MKAHYINELTVGSRVDANFVIRSKEMRAARNGDAYLALTLADRSGAIPAVYFRPARDGAAAPVGSVVRVGGTVTTFRGTKRISVDLMVPVATWDRDDFISPGHRPVEEMKRELSALVRSVSQPRLRAVLARIFSDAEFMDAFSACPASQSFHHSHLGGLLEHTVSVAAICAEMAERYDGVDRDLLVSAALLHDIGKIDELAVDATIAYTDEGRLLGHVVLGVLRVRAASDRVGLDDRTARLLEHALLSHHGELEWGSPKRPSTLEALVLHHVDNLDAKAAGLVSLLSSARRADESWTDATNLFRRPLFAPRAVEDEGDEVPCEDDGARRLSA